MDDAIDHIFRTEAWGNDQLGLFGPSPYAHRPMHVFEIAGFVQHYPDWEKWTTAQDLPRLIEVRCSDLLKKGMVIRPLPRTYQFTDLER